MRIVAGAFRGRRLAAVRGRDVRPTSDKVREAVFSILHDVDGYTVLDLFAGTGAMGLEALSRGAVHATFVEIDRAAHDVVHRNIDAIVTGSTPTADLVKGDAIRVLQTLAMTGERFDLVFFDPPYEQTAELVEAAADTLPAVCAPGARVVLELATRHDALVEHAVDAWDAELVKQRTYGDTTVAVLRMAAVEHGIAPADPDFEPDAVIGDGEAGAGGTA